MSDITFLDITKEHCPMTFVKTKLKLESLQIGEQLCVRLKKGEPLENVPSSVKEQGHDVVCITHIDGDVYEVLITKGSFPTAV